MAHVPRDSDSVVALSLPADLEINRPPCELWDPQTRTYRDQTVPAEVRTTLLELAYSEEDFDTFTWPDRRGRRSVTFGFLRRNSVRALLHEQLDEDAGD